MSKPISRRRFILLGFSSLGFLLFKGSVSALATKTGEEQNHLISFGKPEEYATGGVYKGAGVWLVRDRQGFYALSSRCTHLGCTVEWDGVKQCFICPCHNSKFDVKGSTLQRPAVKPLQPVQVSLNNKGKIMVDLTLKVPADRRLGV